MPLREYDCPKCGTFEVLQKLHDEPLTKHEPCGEPVTKKLSLSSFSLKGGGWYSDGYASTGSKAGGSDAPACATGGCFGGGCGVAQA